MIHACQARIVSDLEIATEATPETVSPVGASGQYSFGSRPTSSASTSNCRSRSTTCPASIASCSSRASRREPTARPIRWKAAPTTACCTSTSGGLPDGHGLLGAWAAKSGVGHRVKVTGPFGSAFFRARPRRPHRSRRQRHRLRPDVVGRGRRDHGAAAARNGLRSWRRETSGRCTCMPRCAGWRCFPTSPSFPWFRSRKTSRTLYAAAGRPIICQS